MFHIQPINGQDHFCLERPAFRVACIAQGFFDGLLGCHADLFEELAHGHVKVFAHGVFSDCLDRIVNRTLGCVHSCRKIAVKLICLLLLFILPQAALAQSEDFTLSADPRIAETGFLQHLLPRFALKHGVRITQVDQGGDVIIGTEGVPVFAGLDTLWHITMTDASGPATLVDWLLSDIGKRTIEGFQPEGAAIFSGQITAEATTPEWVFEGDPTQGEALSLRHCGRCHVINETNRMKGMGQTPSFALMRTFPDWQNRFSTFYALNPHPSFTQVIDITPPFPASLPPAIVPLEVSQVEVEAILAYVATIAPADLGAPLQNQ